MNETIINIGIYASYALIAIGIVAILIFGVAQIAGNPKAAKSALFGIVGLAVVSGLAYALSTGSDATGMYAKLDVTEGSSHMVGAGLYAFYILMALAVLSIIYVEITRLFSKNG
ncbi:hypothetical protein [Owenweeksia hongkongensis]|uniref:hypothetical protein n=1 Tax=Owenweeksia hongkongensis TaxID=253245 RepID=UPI003A9230BB